MCSSDLRLIDQHFEDEVNEWRGKMNPDQYEAVRAYTGSTYKEMNKYLRDGKMGTGESPYLEKLIRDCDKGVGKQQIMENMLVWRKSSAALLNDLGLHYEGNPQAFVNEAMRRVGSVVRDKGFTSTSTKTDRWYGAVHYEIKVPKGSSAAYVNQISKNRGEMEVVINRGTMYRITGARVQTIDGSTHPVIELEIVGRKTR